VDTLSNIAEKRNGPGILILSSSFHILHSNEQAQKYCQMMSLSQPESSAVPPLPEPIRELSAAIFQAQTTAQPSAPTRDIEVTRLIGPSTSPIFLRGLGLSVGEQLQMVIVLMETAGRKQLAMKRPEQVQFQFTPREKSVVEHLMKGWKNRQIAEELDISEQTVKEHIKRIMVKTRTTTRTGVLATILGTA
jgi:DNA-binding CsgD family transcriptional regulator